MAIALIVTVGTTDYSFDWVAQVITIKSGVQEVTAADLKQAIGDAQDDTAGMSFPAISKNANPVVLTPTTSTFLNVILEDQWRIDSFSASGFLVIGAGNVVNVNNGISIFVVNPLVSFINNTSAAGVLVTGGSGVLPSDITDIKNAIFDEIMENSETFAEQIRLMRAEAAGTITKSGVVHNVKSADGLTNRITADADENGRTVTAVDGS
jgi:hypothetical protein